MKVYPATENVDVFFDRLTAKGYSVTKDGLIQALRTPYRMQIAEDGKIIVLNPIYINNEWKYNHDVGRQFIYGESFVRMLPDCTGKNQQYLEREVEELY